MDKKELVVALNEDHISDLLGKDDYTLIPCETAGVVCVADEVGVAVPETGDSFDVSVVTALEGSVVVGDDSTLVLVVTDDVGTGVDL